MSTRWIARIMLGLSLDDRDLDDLIDAAPELVHSDASPSLFALPYWGMKPNPSDVNTLQERWIQTLKAARKRSDQASKQLEPNSHEARNLQKCPRPDCPMRKNDAQHADASESQGASHDQSGVGEAIPLRALQVSHQKNPPKKMFVNAATQLRKRINGVKRVIITDPYVHCDSAAGGTSGGHQALLEFLGALGVKADDPFMIELTPAPKGGMDGAPLEKTPLGKKIKRRFPCVHLTHHKSCQGGFHDRFYLVVDKSARWDGLYGPSVNGLASLAIVLIGDLDKDSPAKKQLKKLLD